MTTRKILSVVVAASVFAGQAQTYYGNGYTIVEQGTVDHRLSGLDAVVFKTIDAYSVQEGLEQLLQGSGWALAGADNADPQIWRLYRQPWPDNKRTLNPMPLSQALSWVAGDGWSLVVDPVNRLVSFEVHSRYAARPAPTAATVANAPAVPTDTVPPVAGTTRVSPAPYDPYGASVSYADSPSYTASHGTTGAYGNGFHDSIYATTKETVQLSPPAADYTIYQEYLAENNEGITIRPAARSVRDVKPLRPPVYNKEDLKTPLVAIGANKAVSGKKRRKAAAVDSSGSSSATAAEKTAVQAKTAAAAAATTTPPATGKKETAASATDKKTTLPASGEKTAVPASNAASVSGKKTAADTTKKSAPATATAEKTAAGKSTTAPAANKGEKTVSDKTEKAATGDTAKNTTAPNSTGGEKQP